MIFRLSWKIVVQQLLLFVVVVFNSFSKLFSSFFLVLWSQGAVSLYVNALFLLFPSIFLVLLCDILWRLASNIVIIQYYYYVNQQPTTAFFLAKHRDASTMVEYFPVPQYTNFLFHVSTIPTLLYSKFVCCHKSIIYRPLKSNFMVLWCTCIVNHKPYMHFVSILSL